ncbi:MAG: 3,4-dihydroxy-2-butanone-4-phosphate synthase [Pyrinomonadaceae bacterium]
MAANVSHHIGRSPSPKTFYSPSEEHQTVVNPKSLFAPIEEAVADIRDGRMVIIVDDERRSRERRRRQPAPLKKDHPSRIVNFMRTHAARPDLHAAHRGALRRAAFDVMQVADNTSSFGTAFTVSIEARKWRDHRHFGVGSRHHYSHRGGHSATKLFGSRPARPRDGRCARAKAASLCVPAKPKRLWISRASRVLPAGVICEIMNPDGSMARSSAARKNLAASAWHQDYLRRGSDSLLRTRKEVLVSARRRKRTSRPFMDYFAQSLLRMWSMEKCIWRMRDGRCRL